MLCCEKRAGGNEDKSNVYLEPSFQQTTEIPQIEPLALWHVEIEWPEETHSSIRVEVLWSLCQHSPNTQVRVPFWEDCFLTLKTLCIYPGLGGWIQLADTQKLLFNDSNLSWHISE